MERHPAAHCPYAAGAAEIYVDKVVMTPRRACERDGLAGETARVAAWRGLLCRYKTMRASFSDPQGKPLWRYSPHLASLAVVAFAALGPLLNERETWIAELVGTSLFCLACALPLRQRRASLVELATGPGYVEVKKAGTRNQRIDARSIVGATTARTARAILFTLAHAKRAQPLTIQVDSDADADRVRAALGIGHGGFGTVGWRTMTAPADRRATGGYAIAFACFTAVSLMVALQASAPLIGFAPLLLCCGVLAWLVGVVSSAERAGAPSIVMTEVGLRVTTKQGWTTGEFAIPYTHVLGIDTLPHAFEIRVPPPVGSVSVERAGALSPDSVSAEDAHALVEQIMAAAARARGLGMSKADVMERIEPLRRNDEAPREWFARLDMQGRLLETSGGAYRGNSLSPEDLWAVLEDPEADPELRAAAARVLRHSPKPDARVRIDAALAAVRDESTTRRLRIALRDDVDEMQQELLGLEAQDRASAARRQLQR